MTVIFTAFCAWQLLQKLQTVSAKFVWFYLKNILHCYQGCGSGSWKRWKRKIFAEAKDESGCGKRISFSLPLLAIHIEIQSLMWCNFLKIINNCKKTFLKSLVSTRSDHCSFLLRLQHSFNLYHNNKAKAND